MGSEIAEGDFEPLRWIASFGAGTRIGPRPPDDPASLAEIAGMPAPEATESTKSVDDPTSLAEIAGMDGGEWPRRRSVGTVARLNPSSQGAQRG